ncbi:hypothetical protein [Xanthomonas phage BUDD]|nr:hypothetical protein [Xanthomonas phage BUDD]
MKGLVIGKVPSGNVCIRYREDASSTDFLPLQPNPSEPPIVIPIEGSGDMFRAIYDKDANGVVDTADEVPVSHIPGLQDTINDIYNQIGSGGGGGGSSQVIFVTNTGGETFLPGMPVCKVGNSYLRARSTGPRQTCLGLAVEASNPGEQLKIQQAGLFTLSPENWDLVTNQVGGLATTMFYYVNIDSQLTMTPPTDFPEYLVKVGYALNNTDFLIDLDLSIKL